MRSLTVSTFLTLDGVMQAPGGPDEDPDGGFAHGGWSVTYWDQAMGEVMDRLMTAPFDLVLGRRTYDIFAAHWPHASDEDGAGPLNAATKYVASRSAPALPWDRSVHLDGDVVQRIAELKRTDGPDLQVHGSADLLQTLIPSGLIDEYSLWVFPLVLGSGKRLFGNGCIPAGLELTGHEVSSTGVLMTRYRPAGDVTLGSFALEDAG